MLDKLQKIEKSKAYSKMIKQINKNNISSNSNSSSASSLIKVRNSISGQFFSSDKKPKSDRKTRNSLYLDSTFASRNKMNNKENQDSFQTLELSGISGISQKMDKKNVKNYNSNEKPCKSNRNNNNNDNDDNKNKNRNTPTINKFTEKRKKILGISEQKSQEKSQNGQGLVFSTKKPKSNIPQNNLHHFEQNNLKINNKKTTSVGSSTQLKQKQIIISTEYDKQYQQLENAINQISQYRVKKFGKLLNKDRRKRQDIFYNSQRQFSNEKQLIKIQNDQFKIQSNIFEIKVIPKREFKFLNSLQFYQGQQIFSLRQKIQQLEKKNKDLQYKLKIRQKEQEQQEEEKSQSFLTTEKTLPQIQESNIKYFDHSNLNLKLSQSNLTSILKQKTSQLQQQIFELRKQKNNLQLKIRIIQRKSQMDIKTYRKKLAMEINNWRQKMQDLKDQNAKLKNMCQRFKDETVSMSLSMQMSVQMQISREHQIGQLNRNNID